MQYGIKSRPYLVFLHYGAERGKSALMSSEIWKPCEVTGQQIHFGRKTDEMLGQLSLATPLWVGEYEY